jgi:hypothetical protein
MAAERVVEESGPLPEIGTETFAYDRDWVVERVEHDGVDTIVNWTPADDEDAS